jgi:hypothetical protein
MNQEPQQPVSTRPKIGFARILKGAQKFKVSELPNVSDTYDGEILTSSGQIVRAILKDLPIRELANELFAAAIGHDLGLALPVVYLAIADQADLQLQNAPMLAGSRLALASEHLQQPSVGQIAFAGKPSNPAAVKAALKPLIAKLIEAERLGEIYGFDAWAANIDRNVGNILIGPASQYWLIDHGRCFTGAVWKASDLQPAGNFPNRLKEWLTPELEPASRQQYAHEARLMAEKLPNIDLRRLGTNNGVETLLGQSDFEALIEFLKARAPYTPELAANALDMVA